MEFKSFIDTILKSINPYGHKDLSERGIFSAINYFIILILVCSMLMLVLFLPLNLPSLFGKTSSLNTVQAGLTFSVNDSFYLSNNPKIKVANAYENFTDEKILVTSDSLYYKKFLFFGKIQHSALVADGHSFNSLIFFILPSIIFWTIIAAFMYFILAVFITFVFGWLFIRLLSLSMRTLTLLKIAIYASTIMILLELLLFPFYRLFLFPIIAYWLLFIICVLLLKDETTPHGKSTLFVKNASPKKDIFAGSATGSRSIPPADHYDVDEHGNSRNGSSRKKSFKEENEGYVELK